MKLNLLLLLLLTLAPLASGLWAQQPNQTKPGEIETTWPGIRYQIAEIDRIPGNRLVVAVKLYATPVAPPGGTMIGVPVPMPAGTPVYLQGAAEYRPVGFSIAPAVMTEEATKQTYSTVAPLPGGPNYIPSEILTTLHPNSSVIMTIQFPCPPPPPPPTDGSPPPKQTVSILLPNARGPITKMAIPPPPAPAPAAGQ